MATEADIPVPVCETRGEQVAHFVDNIIKITVSKLPLEKQTQDDKYNELPAVEGENFLRPPSTGEVHGEVYNVSPDQTVKDGTKLSDQPVELATEEETSVEEIQKNVEESNSTEIVTSDPDADDAKVVTQLSKDTSIDHHGTNESYTENIALNMEISQETSPPSEETESHAPCISEVEELNVQVKTTDNKSADKKPTEEDMSCNLTNEVSEEGESDQNMVTSEKKALANEKSAEDNSNTAAEEGSQENSTSTEMITTLEASNSDKLQSKSDLNSSFSKEEDFGVPFENTLSESHGDTECQSKTLKDVATDHSGPKLTEKSENSLIPAEDSHIEHDEHLEVESERFPLTEVPAGGTNDNVPAAADNVKDDDEDHKGAELSEKEPSTACTLVKEDRHIKNPAESLLVAPENIEVSNLSQEKSIEGPLEEQSTNTTLHGNTIEAEEATVDTVDRQKESLESFPPIVSSSPIEGSMNAVLQEVTSDHIDRNIDEVDNHKEVHKNLSIGEAHSEINNVSPDVSILTEKSDQTVKDSPDTLLISPKLDDQPVEFAPNEETCVEEIQQNAEESSSTEKDGDRGVVLQQFSRDSSVVTSEMKVGDTLDDLDVDDTGMVTQLSNDTGSDHRGTNDSFAENIALTEELLQETNLPCEEIESHVPCISEDGEQNVHVKTTDNNLGDAKTTEEDMCNLTSEVSKGESNQNEMTSDQEVLANERNTEDSFNIVAEEVSQENDTSTETITSFETSNSEESKSDLNSSFSKEEETTVQKCDRSMTTSENSGILLENTLSDGHGDVACRSETLQDAPTEHSDDPKLAEKSEESSLIQVDDSQIERDEQLEEESERLPLIEALTGDTHDNVPTAMDKDKEAESESEHSTRCTSVQEDMQIENPGESLHESPENIEVSNLCQENNIKVPLEEESTSANLLGNTIEAEEATIDVVDRQKESLEIPPIVSSFPEEGSINEVLEEVTSNQTDEKTVDEVDKHKEVLENLSTTLSTEDADGNLLINLDSSENKNEEGLGMESETTSLPLPLERDVSDESKFLHEARFEDGEPKETEFCDNEISAESRTENTEDSLHVTSEDTNAPDLGQETEKTSAIEEQNASTHPQVIMDKRSDCGTVDAAEEKEETLENLPTIDPNEKTEENSSIQDDFQKMENEEHLEKEIDQLSLIKDHTGNVNNDEVIVKDKVKTEDENSSGAELFEKEKNTESVSLPEEVQSEKPVESLHAAPDVKTSDFGQDTEATGMPEEQIPTENSQGISTGDVIDAANTNEKTQELQNGSNEECNKDLLIEVDASETKHDTYLEEETERPSISEASKDGPNGEESTILLEPKTGDECLSKVELPDDEKIIDSTTPKKENVQDDPEGHKTSTSSSDIETTGSLEEQSLAENSQEIISNRIIDATNDKELALENVATEIPQEHTEENLVAQVDCSEGEREELLEKDNQNLSLTEAPIEETNARESTYINELRNKDEDSIKPELETEENTESTLVEEEADVERPGESLQVKPEDIKQHDSSLDINNAIEGQIPTTDPQEISVDNTEGESVDAADTNEESLEHIAKNIPNCDKEDNIPTEEVGSQKPSIEASEGNPNDEQSTKIIEGGLIKEEGSIESLQLAAQDIDTPPLGQDRETSSLDEQSPITTPEGIMDDNKEDIANNATGSEDEPPKEKQDKEKNLQVQEDCSWLEQNEDVGNDSENTPCTEAPIVYNTESSLVKEEENAEKSIEEKILIAEPQETCDKTQEKNVDAANEKNVSLEVED
ncbi:hypothetical protein C2S51_006045 [Perilla frutescens var. frutescens]|nr:hypothetical protein C2S51_006045 [Perilla frutescens var. frutescens]